MVHTERGNHVPLLPGAIGMTLAWLKLERSKQAAQQLPLGALVHVTAVAADRLHAALTRVDSRGRSVGAPHGEVAPSSIVLLKDGDLIVRRAMLSLGMTGECPRPPELSAGAEPAARSDVFGLALVLYELITGRSFGHMLTPDMQRPPGPAPQLTLPLERLSSVPEALDVVLARALAKEPADRYADTAELAAALRSTGTCGSREDVAALLAEWYTPEREREHTRQREQTLQELFNATNELEQLIAEQKKQPLRLVPKQPPPEELLKLVENLPAPPKQVLDIVCTFDDGAQLPRELSSKQAMTQLTQLAGLGFERLGVTLETDVLGGRSTPAIVFAAPAESCFAAMFVSRDEGAPSLFFVTRFEGAWVITSTYPRFERRQPRCVQTGHPGKRVADVLAAHRSELQRRQAAPIPEWDRAAWLALTDAWYASPDLWP